MMETAKRSPFRWIGASFAAAVGYLACLGVLHAALLVLTGVQAVSSALGHHSDVHVGFASLLSLTWTILTAGAILGIRSLSRKISGDIGRGDSKAQNAGRVLLWSFASLLCFMYWYSTVPEAMHLNRRSAEAARNPDGR